MSSFNKKIAWISEVTAESASQTERQYKDYE